LWANAHGAFPIGLVLVGAYLAGNCLRLIHCPLEQMAPCRRKIATLAWLLAVCSLGSLLNPNGWNLHAQILHYLRQPSLVGRVSEFLSPNFHNPIVRGFELELLVLALVLLVLRPRLTATELLLIGGWGYAALHSLRMIPVFSLVVIPILADHLNAFLRGSDTAGWRAYRQLSARVAAIHGGAGGLALVAASLIGVVLAMSPPWPPGARPWLATQPRASAFPVNAVKFVREHSEALRGGMFSVDYWGSYLLFALPEHKVFVYSLHELYSGEVLADYIDCVTLKPGWSGLFDKYDVGWAILPADHRLVSLLSLDRHWKEIHRDAVAVIYLRQPPATAASPDRSRTF